MAKILFTDLDGTLLTDDKKISSKNKEAIQKMLHQVNYFVICTGRPVASGRIVAKELGLTSAGCYMICFNGAVVYDCSSDRILFQKSLAFPDVQRLFEEAKKAGIHIQTYNDTHIVALEHSRELDFYVGRSNVPYKLVLNVFDALDKEPQKVLMIDTENSGKLQRFLDDNIEWTKKTMNAFFSCEEYLEYCPKGIDKGTGVRELTSFLNLSIEDTIAVGDERNDIAMIHAAHLGIAMKNAHDIVKEEADIVTEHTNNEDAIAEIIEKYICV